MTSEKDQRDTGSSRRELVRGTAAGPRPRLLRLSEPQLLIAGERLRQDLDRDITIELRIPRAVHLSHAAHADLGGDLIRAEVGAGDQGHASRA